jgi:glycine cleavage system H protein
MIIPEGLFYTKEHEWIKIDGDTATVGITDYAQNSLGDITFVELPDIGSEINQADKMSTIESVKAASDVYAPLSGTVIKTNQDIVNSPELINQSPYDRAWFAIIQIKDVLQKNHLMNAAEYKQYVEGL